MCIYICFYSTVISEPGDGIACEGEPTTFTCVLNGSISSDDVQWYRLLKDTGTTVMIDPDDDHFTISPHTGNTTNSSLTITNTINSYIGYYWVRLSSGDSVCNVSLTAVTTSMCMYRIQCNIDNFAFVKRTVFILKFVNDIRNLTVENDFTV